MWDSGSALECAVPTDGWTMEVDRRTMGDGRTGPAAAAVSGQFVSPMSCGVHTGGAVPGTTREVSSIRRFRPVIGAFSSGVYSGQLEEALAMLARHLHQRGQLNLDEAFVDATLATTEKGR